MQNTDGAMPAMKLELVPMPVTDVDRAKAFYEKAGFKLEVDTRPNATMRVVQFTPPGSACTIVFGTGMGKITDMQPGSLKGLHLVVADIHEAREALIKRGHKLRVSGPWTMGSLAAIVVDPKTGVLSAGTDPRVDAYAIAW